MAHLIDETTGQAAAFFARTGAWHELGTVVEQEQTWEDAVKLAHLDWTADKVPVYLAGPWRQVPNCYAIQRSDTKAILSAGHGETYRPFQNRDAFRFMDEVVGSGLASFHSAGALKGGRLVWCLCILPGDMGTPLDQIKKFALFLNSHDRSMKITMMLTPIRVVCWNTLNAAIGELTDGDNGFRVRHILDDAGVTRMREDAKIIIAGAQDQMSIFDATAQQWMGLPLTDEDYLHMTMQLYAPPAHMLETHNFSKIPGALVRNWNRMFGCFKGGKGQDLVGAKGTVWGGFNGVTEFVDYYRSSFGRTEQEKKENRAGSVLFGGGSMIKNRAARILTQFVETGDINYSVVSRDQCNRVLDTVDVKPVLS
jgi:phage/plasmid-like protein (TIGR03299 family)